MQVGLLVIGMLIGAVAAIAVIASGHAWWLGLLTYSLVGSLGVIMTALLVYGLDHLSSLSHDPSAKHRTKPITRES